MNTLSLALRRGNALARVVTRAQTGITTVVTNNLGSAVRDVEMPHNVKGVDAAQRSRVHFDRSREMSGLQTECHYDTENPGKIDEENKCEMTNGYDEEVTNAYDLDGNAHLDAALTNVPEPFNAIDVGNCLKEGIPEGLSDNVGTRGQRWTMEERINMARDTSNF